MQAVIIEDERSASQLLQAILVDRCPSIDVAGIAPSVEEARVLLHEFQPDIIFLDVELADGRGFELMPFVDFSISKIIFTTAYDQFALQAFDYGAIDYILKPYGPKEVVRAVNRVREVKNDKETIDKLYEALRQVKTETTRISIPTASGIQYIETVSIVRCEADANYTIVVTSGGDRHIVSKTLKMVEDLIDNDRFVRSHKTHLINLDHVVEVTHNENEQIVLSNGEAAPLSRRRRQAFVQAL